MVSINEISDEKINAFKKYISSSEKIQFQELNFLSNLPKVIIKNDINKNNDNIISNSELIETLYPGKHIYTEYPNDNYICLP